MSAPAPPRRRRAAGHSSGVLAGPAKRDPATLHAKPARWDATSVPTVYAVLVMPSPATSSGRSAGIPQTQAADRALILVLSWCGLVVAASAAFDPLSFPTLSGLFFLRFGCSGAYLCTARSGAAARAQAGTA